MKPSKPQQLRQALNLILDASPAELIELMNSEAGVYHLDRIYAALEKIARAQRQWEEVKG